MLTKSISQRPLGDNDDDIDDRDVGMKERVYVQVKMAVKLAGQVWWIIDVTNMIYVMHLLK